MNQFIFYESNQRVKAAAWTDHTIVVISSSSS